MIRCIEILFDAPDVGDVLHEMQEWQTALDDAINSVFGAKHEADDYLQRTDVHIGYKRPAGVAPSAFSPIRATGKMLLVRVAGTELPF